MWMNSDISKLNIVFEIEDTIVRLMDVTHGILHTDFPNHMHSFYELHYVCGGRGKLVTDRQAHAIEKGSLCLIGPRVYHEQITDPDDPIELFTFSFDLSQKTHDQTDKTPLTDILHSADLWIQPDITAAEVQKNGSQKIEDAFRTIEKEYWFQKIGYIYIIRERLEQIIIELLRCMQQPPHVTVKKSTPDDRRKFVIDETFIFSYRDITLESLAKKLNLSPRQTNRVIQKEYGESFSSLRKKARLNAACHLLLAEPEMSISQISEKVGFGDRSYFVSLFRETFGTSPSDWRRKNSSHRE